MAEKVSFRLNPDTPLDCLDVMVIDVQVVDASTLIAVTRAKNYDLY